GEGNVMFQIRQEQLEAFSVSALHHANRRLAQYARQRFPARFADTEDAVLYELACKVRARAKEYDIELEKDVATFLDFTVMYGEGCPDAPWALPVLEYRMLQGPDRREILRMRVRETGVAL